MQNQIITNGSKVDTKYGVFEVLEYDFVRDQYFCYKKYFDGHSGEAYFCHKYIDTKYEDNCWWFFGNEVTLIEESEVGDAKQSKFKAGDKVRCVEADQGQWIEEGETYTVKKCALLEYVQLEEIVAQHNYNESRFELVSEKQKPNYREMKPTDMVKVCIGDNEFEVPLGDLVHDTALLGVTNGSYGFRLWEALTKALGEEGFVDDIETLIEFSYKQKEALDYFFQPYYDKQQQDKEELHNLISAKQKEVEQLLEKLSQM